MIFCYTMTVKKVKKGGRKETFFTIRNGSKEFAANKRTKSSRIIYRQKILVES